mgnify:CR=1 FL=1
MGQVHVYLGCSLDGCIAGPDHDLAFLMENPPPTGDEPEGWLGFEAFLASVGALLMGRRTYQVLLDNDAWHYGERTVFVATHHELPPAPQGGDARPVSGSIDAMLDQALAGAAGRDVYLDGGDLVRQGIASGRVDTLCLTFLPLLLGRGIRLWDGLETRRDLRFGAHLTHGSLLQVRAEVARR